MEATCTPGLPTVVTTLVSMTSRPAAAPLSTLIDAGAVEPPSDPKPEAPKPTVGEYDCGPPEPGTVPGFMIMVFS